MRSGRTPARFGSTTPFDQFFSPERSRVGRCVRLPRHARTRARHESPTGGGPPFGHPAAAAVVGCTVREWRPQRRVGCAATLRSRKQRLLRVAHISNASEVYHLIVYT